jgi:TRAP transporter TAXI family solute receptor
MFGEGATAQEGGKAISSTTNSNATISRTTISLGTATPGGGFPLYGNAFADIINTADPALSVEPRNTKGSNENIPMLEAGQLDIATVAGEPSYEAFMGVGRPATKLKILTAMYSSPGMFVVRADSPYKTIRDLVGQPVAFGARGSGLPILSRYILDGIGLKQDEDFKSIYLDRAGDGPAMVQDGRAGALWGAGIGWPGFAAQARSRASAPGTPFSSR